MPTGVGTIDVSNCSDTANNGQYTLIDNMDGTWSFTGNPSSAESPMFIQNGDGTYQFSCRAGNHTCFLAKWNGLPSGAPNNSQVGFCSGCEINAYGF